MVHDISKISEYSPIIQHLKGVGNIIDLPNGENGVIYLTLTLAQKNIYNISLHYTKETRYYIWELMQGKQTSLKKYLKQKNKKKWRTQ